MGVFADSSAGPPDGRAEHPETETEVEVEVETASETEVDTLEAYV